MVGRFPHHEKIIGFPYYYGGVIKMRKFLTSLKKFGKDEKGAALIEYTVLLGIMLVAVIATIVFVGSWISGQWTSLSSSLP
jgi:pilus assembly protein Flp/PilA